MKLAIIFASTLLIADATAAPKISCRQDADTKAAACYETKSVRSNGELRSFIMATGGPKGVKRSPYMAVVNCRVKYLELRDKQGVVFARKIPPKPYMRGLVHDVCQEPKPKPDKTLD